MNASKENAQQALEDFLAILDEDPSLYGKFKKRIQHISTFIAAARRKLPSEAAFQHERERVKKVSGTKTADEIVADSGGATNLKDL